MICCANELSAFKSSVRNIWAEDSDSLRSLCSMMLVTVILTNSAAIVTFAVHELAPEAQPCSIAAGSTAVAVNVLFAGSSSCKLMRCCWMTVATADVPVIGASEASIAAASSPVSVVLAAI